MKSLLFCCFIVVLTTGCFSEYRYPKKRVVVYDRLNYRNNYNRPLYYNTKNNMRFSPYSNKNRFKTRRK